MAYVLISYEGEEIGRQNLKGTILIGRSPECDISVHDILLSRKHCRLNCSRGQWRLTDLASRNGTKVNDHRVEKHDLKGGDIIRVGNTTVEFHVGIAPPLRATGKKRIERPADPHEALSGTVFAHEALTESEPAPAMLAGRPVPRPAPLPPKAYEREGVDSMVLNMLSDLHDSMIAQLQTKPRQPSARPILRNLPPKPPVQIPVTSRRPRPQLEPSPITELGPLVEEASDDIPSSPILERAVRRREGGDALVEVAAAVATLAPPKARVAPMPARTPAAKRRARAQSRPSTPAEAICAVPEPPAAAAALRPRRKRRIASLDLWMAVLLVWTLVTVVFATRTLFLMS